MAIKIATLTLITGTPVNVLAAVRAGVLGTKEQAKWDIALRAISLQPRGANAAVAYVGDTDQVSATSYGVRLEAGSSGIPPAPWIMGEFETGPLHYSDFWILGATGDFIQVLAIPF